MVIMYDSVTPIHFDCDILNLKLVKLSPLTVVIGFIYCYAQIL